MAAGIASLEELASAESGGRKTEPVTAHTDAAATPHSALRTPHSDAYARLETLGAQLEAGMKEAAAAAKVPVQFNRCGSMFCGYFTSGPVHNVADAMHSDRERFKKYFHGMLAEGIYLAPSQFEAGFISTAHTAAEIEQTVRAATKVLRTL